MNYVLVLTAPKGANFVPPVNCPMWLSSGAMRLELDASALLLYAEPLHLAQSLPIHSKERPRGIWSLNDFACPWRPLVNLIRLKRWYLVYIHKSVCWRHWTLEKGAQWDLLWISFGGLSVERQNEPGDDIGQKNYMRWLHFHISKRRAAWISRSEKWILIYTDTKSRKYGEPRTSGGKGCQHGQ